MQGCGERVAEMRRLAPLRGAVIKNPLRGFRIPWELRGVEKLCVDFAVRWLQGGVVLVPRTFRPVFGIARILQRGSKSSSGRGRVGCGEKLVSPKP